MSLAPFKLAIVVGYGQSNEAGHGCKFGDALSSSNPITPSYMGIETNMLPGRLQQSMFDTLCEMIAKFNGHTVMHSNFGIDGTAVVGDWTGFTGSAGTTDAPKNFGDSGYDPNGHIAHYMSEITRLAAAGYTVWNIIQGHQNDDSESFRTSSVITADTALLNRAIAAGASKVFYGTTPRNLAVPTHWDAGQYFPTVRAGIFANMASVPQFVQGPDLTDLAPTVGHAQTTDSVHVNGLGSRICGGLGWYETIVAAGLV